MKKIKIGSEVAFNKRVDATWFKVEEIDSFLLTVREINTHYSYATQRIDSCFVAQVR